MKQLARQLVGCDLYGKQNELHFIRMATPINWTMPWTQRKH